MIATSPEGYEALALKLAREPSFLTAIKAKLASNRDAHPLFDTAHGSHATLRLHTQPCGSAIRDQSEEAPMAFTVQRIDQP
jgi:hypothetical protein